MKTTHCYNAWRKFEAYAVPVTEDGVEAMQRRHNCFKAGWNAAVEHAIYILMEEHDEHDHIHNIYHVSANIVKDLKDD